MATPTRKTLIVHLLLVLAGIANTLSFAPYNHYFVSVISLVILQLFISTATPKQALTYGFSYGLGWFGGAISWVHVSIATYGEIPLIASLTLMALLIGYLAIYPALTCYLTKRFTPTLAWWPFSFAAFWFLCEWLRSVMLTGFPWASLGYGQINSPLATLAPVIGEIGITLVLCMISSALTLLLKRQHLIVATSLLALITTSTLLTPSNWTKALNKSTNLLLVQGNIPQSIRWNPENDWPNMLKHLDLTRPHYDKADIIIWPEAAIPILEPLAQDELHNLNQVTAQHQVELITGIIDYHSDSKTAYNSLITLGLRNHDDQKGQYYYLHQNRYTKHHLLPIGEFVPFEDLLRPLGRIFDLPMSSFTRGEPIQSNLRANGINLAPAICYEIIFPRLLRQNINAETDIILTVSNDAWFGDSIGPHQHMQIAQMRSLEFGRPVARATNNGVTAVTDHQGNITAKLPQFKADVLPAKVNLVTGQTPYALCGTMDN